MKPRLFLIAQLLFLLLSCSFPLQGQEKFNVISKGFHLYSGDSSKLYLEKKLPLLICVGINYNSALNYIDLQKQADTSLAGLNYKTVKTDSIYKRSYQALFDSLQVRLFLEGNIIVVNQQFSLEIRGTDFSRQLIPFKSDFKPFAELSNVIDQVSENLNYQLRMTGKEGSVITATVLPFVKKNLKGDYNGSDIFYDRQFPSLYLMSNLVNSKNVIIRSGDQGDSPAANNVEVTGTVTYTDKNNCTIRPVIRISRTDSLSLPAIKGNIDAKDSLLKNTLQSVQSILNILGSDEIKPVRDFIGGGRHTPAEYERVFFNYYNAGNYQLAYCFADLLANAYPAVSNNGALYKALILIKQKSYADAIDLLLTCNAPVKADVNYYLGIAYLENGNYNKAILCFDKVPADTQKYPDVAFQKGRCYYYQGRFQKAIDCFSLQQQSATSVPPELTVLKAYSYGSLNQWDAGLNELNTWYLSDFSKTNRKQILSDYYSSYADFQLKNKNYQAAYTVYKKVWDLKKTDNTLMGQYQALSFLDKPDQELAALLDTGISSGLFNKKLIYRQLIAFYESTAKDEGGNYIPYRVNKLIQYNIINDQVNPAESNDLDNILGTQYFRIQKLDSALFYYRRSVKNRPQPLSYLNLIELQVIAGYTDEALVTLKKLNSKFSLTTDQYTKDIDGYAALYYFYTAVCYNLQKRNAGRLLSAMQVLLSKHPDRENGLIGEWDFNVFAKWLREDNALPQVTKANISRSLCVLIPYSYDKSIVCVNGMLAK